MRNVYCKRKDDFPEAFNSGAPGLTAVNLDQCQVGTMSHIVGEGKQGSLLLGSDCSWNFINLWEFLFQSNLSVIPVPIDRFDRTFRFLDASVGYCM